MATINYFKKEIHVKIVYVGPGLSGKTTNLQWLNQNLHENKVGKLISLATKTDRTLFFDLLAVSLGKIRGFDARIQLFTTPGQVFYNATRKLVLKGADGIVFVADSQEPMQTANLESLENIRGNIVEYGRKLEEIPLVFQYNKRDLNNVLSLEQLQEDLNPQGLPYFEAAAVSGEGVKQTFDAIVKATFANLREIQEGNSEEKPPTPSAPQAIAAIDISAEKISDLEIRNCLEPRVSPEGLVTLPLVVYSPKYGEEFRLTLELKVKNPQTNPPTSQSKKS